MNNLSCKNIAKLARKNLAKLARKKRLLKSYANLRSWRLHLVGIRCHP